MLLTVTFWQSGGVQLPSVEGTYRGLYDAPAPRKHILLHSATAGPGAFPRALVPDFR